MPADQEEKTLNNEKTGWLQRFKRGLQKTRQNLSGRLESLIVRAKRIDDDFWEELEEILIQADVGVNTSLALVEKVQYAVKKQKLQEPEQVLELIRQEVVNFLTLEESSELCLNSSGPSVILVVGVNGAGKTTSMANWLTVQTRAAGAAVQETHFGQLLLINCRYGRDRIGVDIIKHQRVRIREQ